MYRRIRQQAKGSFGSRAICVNVPCCACATNLNGLLSHGQCPECGMDISKSLSVAALRCDDPESLERLSTGLDINAWAPLLAMLACILGPLVLRGPVSFTAFGIVVAGLLSAAGIWAIRAAAVRLKCRGIRKLPGIVPLASISVVIPAQLVHMELSQGVGQVVLVLLLAGVALWFSGECQKLRQLEEVALQVPQKGVGIAARNLRWGIYVAALLLAVGLSSPLFGGRLGGNCVVMASVALLTFTLMTALLYSRMSQAVRCHANAARVVMHASCAIQSQRLADEPVWLDF